MEGFKAFNQDLTNRYGQKFEKGKIYRADKGFHMCVKFEDCFRFFDSENSVLTKIEASGQIIPTTSQSDEYYGYDEKYTCEYIEITKLLNREDILNMAINLNDIRVLRFLQLYKLNEEEQNLFEETYPKLNRKVLQYYDYYQKGNKNAFKI